MTEKKFADEILTDEQLDGVTGGTTQEFEKIIQAISSNEDLVNKFKQALSDVPGGNISLENMKEPVTTLLKGLGIDAKINLNSTLNSYKDTKTGKSLSHDKVISTIKNYV